jgi:hypothetical protein
MSQAHVNTITQFTGQKLLRVCVVALVAGVLLAIIGPFGTFERMNTGARFIFWGGAVGIGALIHVPLFYGAAYIGRTRSWPTWAWVTGSAFVAALPMTFVVNGIAASLFRGGSMDDAFSLYPLVLAISTPMQWIAYFTSGFDKALTPSQEPFAVPTPTHDNAALQSAPLPSAPTAMVRASPLLFARLPARLGKDIICLEMEDHYVRVHTKLGEVMIHLRMSDAVGELGGLEGMLVHRSWWVAREAITGWSRDGKTLLLQLSNGKRVPVARDRQPLVRAAGWLE